MQQTVTEVVNLAVWILQGLAALVVVYGGVVTFFSVIYHSVKQDSPQRHLELSRIYLGRKLVIGLEFLLGADILRTAITPTWQGLGTVAAIVIIRTALNYVLQRDIEHIEERLGASPYKEKGNNGKGG